MSNGPVACVPLGAYPQTLLEATGWIAEDPALGPGGCDGNSDAFAISFIGMEEESHQYMVQGHRGPTNWDAGAVYSVTDRSSNRELDLGSLPFTEKHWTGAENFYYERTVTLPEGTQVTFAKAWPLVATTPPVAAVRIENAERQIAFASEQESMSKGATPAFLWEDNKETGLTKRLLFNCIEAQAIPSRKLAAVGIQIRVEPIPVEPISPKGLVASLRDWFGGAKQSLAELMAR